MKISVKTIVLAAVLLLPAVALAQSTTLPAATAGVPYSQTLSFDGLSVVLPYAVTGTNLPGWLALGTTAPWTLNGAPPAGGSPQYDFTVTVTGADGKKTDFKLTLPVHAAPVPAVVTLKPAAASCAVPGAHPSITGSVSETSTSIIGQATSPQGCTAKLRVWAYKGLPIPDNTNSSLKTEEGSAVALKAVPSPSSDGTFTIQLADAVDGGEKIMIEQYFVDDKGNELGSNFSLPVTVRSTGDWGLVRANFTSGILMSQDQGSFSSSSLFLAFDLDKTWRAPTRNPWRIGVNSFFETRLTSIPVTAQPCSSTSTGSASTSSCNAAQQGSSNPTDFNTFLTSRKTARLQVGVYFPLLMKGWEYNGRHNELFIAPLAKTGFDTPTGPINQTQAQAQSTSAGNASGPVTAVNDTNFYNFYAYGARIGHYAMPKSDNIAPDLISYLDFGVGRFSNLETYYNNNTQRRRLYRISLEGILKVPSTPLIIGFNANIGQESLGAGHNITHRAGDDLRFLFGTRFDVAKLVDKLKTSAP